MRFSPISSMGNIHLQRDIQVIYSFHLLPDNRDYSVKLFLRHIKDEFIMYLKEHFRSEALPVQSLVNVDHCLFDKVCCRALNRGIYCHALCFGTYSGPVAVYFRQIPLPV